MKKTLFLCVLVVLAAALVFASPAQQGGAAPAGGTVADPYANAPREVSMTVLNRGQVPASEGTYEDNRWVRWINENSPVKVTFVSVPRNGSRDAITALYAAGTAPDVVWEYNKSTMDLYYDQGVIQPVADHIEKYSVAYKEYLQKNADLLPFLIADDGQQYGMTSRRTIQSLVNQSIFVRKDWLDKFGLGLPTTVDEALAFMRRAVNEDPDGNGVKDTWGVGTDYSWPIITTAIFGKPSQDFNVVDGHFVDWFSTPAYRDSLAFLAQVYQEGLIDPEYITDSPNFTRQQQFMVTGKIAMRFQGMGFEGQYYDFMKNVPTADFVPIDPLTSSRGKFGFGQEVPFNKMVLMSKNARNPKAIMEYMDWLISGGYFTLTYGLEGQHHRLVNGVPQVIDPARNRIELDYSGEFSLVDDIQMTLDWIPVRASQDPISQDWAKRYASAISKTLNTQFLQYVPYTPTSPAIQAYNAVTAGISSHVFALETQIMIGRLSVDEGLRQINEFKRASGWDQVNAEKDAWFQKNKHLFGY